MYTWVFLSLVLEDAPCIAPCTLSARLDQPSNGHRCNQVPTRSISYRALGNSYTNTLLRHSRKLPIKLWILYHQSSGRDRHLIPVGARLRFTRECLLREDGQLIDSTLADVQVQCTVHVHIWWLCAFCVAPAASHRVGPLRHRAIGITFFERHDR